MNFFLLSTGGGLSQLLSGDGVTTIIMVVAMVGVMYFLMIKPQKKREKTEKEMRDSIEVGDGVTTIGGIVGRVVSTKEDTILIETGTDRTKLRILRGAISQVEKLKLDE